METKKTLYLGVAAIALAGVRVIAETTDPAT
jgi:hypothetical protein